MTGTFLKSIQPYIIGIVFLLLYLAEHIFPQRNKFIDLKHDATNAVAGIINAVITFFGGYYFEKAISFLNDHHFGLFNIITLPFILQLILQIIVLDIFMYWWHRINHIVPFLWRFHKFHHADRKLNATSALRFHAVEISLSYIARLLIFPFLGISISAIVIYGFLFFPVIILHHSNIKIKENFDFFLRKIIVSPRMHRIHHSNFEKETNSNYSSVFPWWDKLFKSYTKKPVKEIEFGLDK